MHLQILALDYGSAQYYQQSLPTNTIPPYTACPFWDDLYLYGGTTEGVYYQLNSTSGTVTYEYILSGSGMPSDYYQYQVHYATSAPGVIYFRYFVVGELSGMAVVGVQGGECSFLFQFSLSILKDWMKRMFENQKKNVVGKVSLYDPKLTITFRCRQCSFPVYTGGVRWTAAGV